MYKIKTAKYVMIISLFMVAVIIALIISMNKIDKQTENTTSSFMATVEKAVVNTNSEKPHAQIYTVEYDNFLYITKNIGTNIRIDDIKDLKKGEKIYFRIENIKVKQMNKVEFIDIVSLKTNAKNIFTLEEYNEYMHDSFVAPRIAAIVLSLIFLGVALYCFFTIKRENNQGTVP